jgi:TatD DNase family protein
MELFDTHCHIQSAGSATGERSTRALWAKAGDTSVDDIVARAADKGVTRMICVGCDLQDSELAIETVKTRENLWASIGIHPHEAKVTLQNGLLEPFAALLDASIRRAVPTEGSETHLEDGPIKVKKTNNNRGNNNKIVAIGECGLDYFYTHSPKKDQREVLQFQMGLAQRHDLPMIFHVREAFSDFWPVFDEFSDSKRPIRGVLHSFTDNQANLDKALKRGLYIGVNGIATFTKDADQLDDYRRIPLANLLLETDAPFLTPVPYRGSICEPYHVETTAHFLSNLRGEQLDILAQATTSNAQQLFGI